MERLMSVMELHQMLTGRNVLSVYIAAEEHDPTERSSWRLRLARGLDETERGIDSGERSEFVEARRHLENGLSSYMGFLPGRGWAAFVTADGVRMCTEVPATMPDRVRWRRGPVLGPWLRTSKQQRPVAIALVDSRRARLLRYQEGELTEDVDYRADSFIDDLTDRNMSKRATTRSGVRGETATDAADRVTQREMDKLLERVGDAIAATRNDALIVIGGSAVAAAALRAALPAAAMQRALVEPSLYVTMTSAEIRDVVEGAASVLTQSLQLSTARHVVDLAAGGDRAILGPAGCASAAELGQVELLLLTPRFLEGEEDRAEELIALVLNGGGAIDAVAGEAADLLDSAAAGAAVRLRYVMTAPAANLAAVQTLA
jgi:hypothetical protein